MGAAIRDRKPPVAIGPTSLSRTNTPPSAKHPTASTAHAIAPPLARPPTARRRCCIIMSPSSCLPLLLTPTAASPAAYLITSTTTYISTICDTSIHGTLAGWEPVVNRDQALSTARMAMAFCREDVAALRDRSQASRTI